jgi:inosine/xanthosine triphosphatase
VPRRRYLVAIGSRNPAKTLGTRKVFSMVFPSSRFVDVDTSSVVKAQPIGIEEVVQGASKRAHFALGMAKADFGVGVEAGVLLTGDAHVNLQAAFIVDKNANSGLGLSSGFLIPKSFIDKMKREGTELDRYSHELTGAVKITEEEGIVYHLTGGRTSRLQMTEQSVGMALIPWLNKKTYEVK